MKTKYIAITALLLTLASSCQREPLPNNPQGAASAPLKIAVGTQGVTRSPILGKWFHSGAQVNVILLDAGATTTYNIMQPYVLDRPDDAAGVWAPTATSSLQVKTDLAKVLAHYPVSDQTTLSSDKLSITPTTPDALDLGENNVSVLYEAVQMRFDPIGKPNEVLDIFSAKADIDYMTGTGNDVSTTPPNLQTTLISMKHAKAMVVVHLFKQAEYIGSEQLTQITIGNTATGTKPLKSGTFLLADNSFVATVPDVPVEYVRTMSAFPLGTRYSVLAYPAVIGAGDVKIDIQVGAVKYTLPIGAMTWSAGKVYLYNIQLSASGLELKDAVGVYDWPEAKEHKIELE